MKRKQQIKEIFNLCLKISNKGKYFAFFYFSPHVKKNTITITPASDYTKTLYQDDIYYGVDMTSKEAFDKQMSEIKEKLNEFLEGKI